MKKALLTILLLLCTTIGLYAESEIMFKTDMEYGEMIAFNPIPVSAGKIYIDWGDGDRIEYDADPSSMTYLLRREHKLMGNTVHIYGEFTEITLSGMQITDLALVDQPRMTKFSASNNKLTYATTDLSGAPNLTMLDLSKNKIHMLNLRNHSKLEYLTIYNNPELTTIAFADGNPNLRQISMYGCDVVHFYDEYDFPKLTSLDLHDNSLWDITLTPEHYPALTSLNLAGNGISELDVSGLTTLETLSVSNNKLTTLNVAANTELTSLYVNGNKQMEKINLSNNAKMRYLSVASTAITSIDISNMPSLLSLNIDSLDIKKVDTGGLRWLQTLTARATKLEYLDFTANYFQLRQLDLRGCKHFTAQTLNFMFTTMSNPDRSGTIYLEGCNGAAQANPNKLLYLGDPDCKWNVDVVGDGSASMEPVNITLNPATGGTYKLMRRDFVWSLDKDAWARNYEEATDGKVVPGYVNRIDFMPEEGLGYLGVKVNGTFVADTLFYALENSTIEAVFGEGGIQPNGGGGNMGDPDGPDNPVPTDVNMQRMVKFSVQPGVTSQYGFAADVAGTKIAIDWGDGDLVNGTLSNEKYTYFDGQTEGNTVTVYGDLTYINVESYPYGFGIDNQIRAIDLSANDKIHQLIAYWNMFTSIDVSNQAELYSLDVAMNEDLTALDVTHNPLLMELTAYDLDINKLDLSKNPYLYYVDVKNNGLNELDLSNAVGMETLNVTNNNLTLLNVTNMPKLDVLRANGNKLKTIDLSRNTLLHELGLGDNELESIDLSALKQLERLDISRNNLTAVDLSKNTSLWYIEARANGWDACQVNDFFHFLPEYASPGEDVEKTATGTKLWVAGTTGANDHAANDVEHSESLLLSGKGWLANFTDKGDGTGCDYSYVYIMPTENGEVSLVDDDLNSIASGTPVKKNSTVTIVATPNSGYAVKSMKANGQDVTDNKFVVTRVTDVAVKFELNTVIEGATRVLATAEAGHGEIDFTTTEPVTVSIYSLNGQHRYSATITGNRTVGLRPGIYVVTMKQGDHTATSKLYVK